MPKPLDICNVQWMARYTDRLGRRNKRNAVPGDVRTRLEAARLDLRALYRALDRMQLAQDLPDELMRLQELDADFAEALWVLDQPPGRFDMAMMMRDTLCSLNELPDVRERFLASAGKPASPGCDRHSPPKSPHATPPHTSILSAQQSSKSRQASSQKQLPSTAWPSQLEPSQLPTRSVLPVPRSGSAAGVWGEDGSLQPAAARRMVSTKFLHGVASFKVRRGSCDTHVCV